MASEAWFPSPRRMTLEIIATVIGVVGASILISRVPAIKALVDGNSVWALTNPSASTSSTS